jgi:hypothetical protein
LNELGQTRRERHRRRRRTIELLEEIREFAFAGEAEYAAR